MNVRFDVPVDLRQRRQWVIWRRELRGDRSTKVPYRATSPQMKASATDPKTWGSFEQAVSVLERHRCHGIGYVFSPNDPFVGVDVDSCMSEAGELSLFGQRIVGLLDSYTELSPSGRGVHVIVRASLDGDSRRRRGRVEIYSEKRFFTISSRRLPGLPHAPLPRQRQLDELRAELFPPPEPSRPGHVHVADDRELVDRMLRARNGQPVLALWEGRWQDRYSSQSEADLALCRHLSFWTGGDEGRVDALFRASGLYREKWDRPSYRQATLKAALE